MLNKKKTLPAGRRIFAFNMVEVALAMLVISLGLSTVLVLFPAGLKASRQAEDESNLIEAAEAMETYIRNKFTADPDGDFEVDILDHDDDDGTADKVLETSFSTTSTANKHKAVIADKDVNAFLYRKLVHIDGESVSEFSCVVRLLKPDLGKGIKSDVENDSAIAYFPTSGNGDDKISDGSKEIVALDKITANNLPDYLQVVDMEISYPAGKPYKDRKKKVFRLEMFDESYDKKP